MENAAKALLMAGGVLIALLVIGSLVLLFTNLQDYQNKTDASVLEAQIAKYNSQYEPYNKKGLTLMELKSVYNKIVSNNKENPEYEIYTNINDSSSRGAKVKTISVPIYNYYMIKDFKEEIEERHKQLKRFDCIDIKYDGIGGRISLINFADSTPQEKEALITY